jgi:hypothetical protein
MNIQLIDSIIKLVDSLSPEEKKTIVLQLNSLISVPQEDTVSTDVKNAAQQLAEMGGTQPDLKPIPRRSYTTDDSDAYAS